MTNRSACNDYAKAQMLSQLAGAPMRRAIGGRLLSRLQNPGLLTDDRLRDNLATMSRIQTRQAFLNKSFFRERSNDFLKDVRSCILRCERSLTKSTPLVDLPHNFHSFLFINEVSR